MPRVRWVRRLSLWTPPLAYASVIFYLSSESNPLPQLTALVWDKALHLIEYAGLALLLVRALAGEGLGWRAAICVAIAVNSAYGASDEWHQFFVPGRDAYYHDWIADTCGGTLGAAVYGAISAVLRRRWRFVPTPPEGRTAPAGSHSGWGGMTWWVSGQSHQTRKPISMRASQRRPPTA